MQTVAVPKCDRGRPSSPFENCGPSLASTGPHVPAPPLTLTAGFGLLGEPETTPMAFSGGTAVGRLVESFHGS